MTRKELTKKLLSSVLNKLRGKYPYGNIHHTKITKNNLGASIIYEVYGKPYTASFSTGTHTEDIYKRMAVNIFRSVCKYIDTIR